MYQEEPNNDNVIYFDNSILEKLKDNRPDIVYVVPRIEEFVLSVGKQNSKVAFVKWIDLPKADRFNGFGSRIEEGVFFNPNERDAQADVGKGLAQQLSLSKWDTIVLLGKDHQGTLAAGIFVVTGIVRHPILKWNNSVLFLPLADVQWHYG